MKYSGLFWEKNKPYAKIDCSFEVSNGGEVKLVSSMPFSEDDSIVEPNIYSEINLGSYLSMLNPFYRKKTQRNECTLQADIAFIGSRTIKQKNELKITTFQCELRNTIGFFYERRSFESQSYLTPYKKNLVFKSKQGWSSELSFTRDGKCSLEISSASSEALSFFQNISHKICTFISFSLGDVVYADNVKVVDLNKNSFEVYYKPSFYPRKENRKERALFLYCQNLDDSFIKWCELCDTSEEILRLYYLPMLTELDQTTHFILRAQFLEAFHRKATKNNKITFQKRVLSMFKNCEYMRYIPRQKNIHIELRELARQITHARNYYTHYNENEKFKKPKSNDLIFLNMKMDLISNLFVMDYLGFKVEQFYDISHIVISDLYNRKQIMEQYTKNGKET